MSTTDTSLMLLSMVIMMLWWFWWWRCWRGGVSVDGGSGGAIDWVVLEVGQLRGTCGSSMSACTLNLQSCPKCNCGVWVRFIGLGARWQCITEDYLVPYFKNQ